jgi:hypothetical protein
MLETTYILMLGQLLKITPNFFKYMWQKLKLKKPNITIKHISEHSVAKVVKTHGELDTMAIKVDNQMEVIQIQVMKNIVDVLLDGGVSVNIISKNLRTKLGLPKPRPTPYHLRMVDQSMTKPL